MLKASIWKVYTVRIILLFSVVVICLACVTKHFSQRTILRGDESIVTYTVLAYGQDVTKNVTEAQIEALITPLSCTRTLDAFPRFLRMDEVIFIHAYSSSGDNYFLYFGQYNFCIINDGPFNKFNIDPELAQTAYLQIESIVGICRK